MYKALIVLAIAGVASAGVLDYHVGSTAEQTIRGYGGQSSISHQAKTVNSAFSTSSAYKTKATNNAYPVAYAAPAYATQAYAAPAYAQAVQYASPVHHAIAAPAYAQVAHPVAHAVAAPAYHAVAAPAYARAALPVAHAPVVAKAGLLGVAYSPVVPGVATLNFDGFGVHYGY